MKLAALFLLLYCFECQANEPTQMSNAELEDSIQEMAAHKGEMVQKILYGMVTFCSNEFPDTASLYIETKEYWNKHNLPIMDGSQPILVSLLLNNGIDEHEIGILTKVILNNQKPPLTEEEAQKDLDLRMASRTEVKRLKDCNSMVKAFSGGRFNLDLLIFSDYQGVKEVYKTFPNSFLKSQGKDK